MPKKKIETTEEEEAAKVETLLRKIVTEILKAEDVHSAKERATVITTFMDDHADVVMSVIDGQLALAAHEAFEDDEDDEDDDEDEDEDEDEEKDDE